MSERLLRLTPRKYAASPLANGGPQPRVSSPEPGGSTLITSAPMSPSIMAQSGPGEDARQVDDARSRHRAAVPIGHWATCFLRMDGGALRFSRAAVEILLELTLVAHAELLEVRVAGP